MCGFKLPNNTVEMMRALGPASTDWVATGALIVGSR
jgi:hypothetical protein